MFTHGTGDIPGLLPLLVAHLNEGWRLATGRCIHAAGDEFDLAGLLPAGTRLEYMVPQLQERKPADEAEANLARYVHVVLPEGEDPEEYLARLRELACFDEVRKPPEVSLPDGVD